MSGGAHNRAAPVNRLDSASITDFKNSVRQADSAPLQKPRIERLRHGMGAIGKHRPTAHRQEGEQHMHRAAARPSLERCPHDSDHQ